MSDKEQIEILYNVVKELVQRVDFLEERGLRYEDWIDRPSSNFDNLPEKLTTFIAGPGGIDITSVEGILNTDMFTIFAPLVTIGFAIFFGYNATKKEEQKRTLDIVDQVLKTCEELDRQNSVKT